MEYHPNSDANLSDADLHEYIKKYLEVETSQLEYVDGYSQCEFTNDAGEIITARMIPDDSEHGQFSFYKGEDLLGTVDMYSPIDEEMQEYIIEYHSKGCTLNIFDSEQEYTTDAGELITVEMFMDDNGNTKYAFYKDVDVFLLVGKDTLNKWNIRENVVEDNLNNQVSAFRTEAMNGPSYNELLKSSKKYIGVACNFRGKVIQAVEYDNEKNFFLIDTSSSANAFIDMDNEYGDSGNYTEHIDSKLVAVYSDVNIDVLADDNLEVWGTILSQFTYQDNYGSNNTIPAIKIVEYERAERISEWLNED